MQIIARFCPHFFNGSEKELVKLLKDNNNNDMIREGILTILAKAGGTIREQLSVTSRCHCQTHKLLISFPFIIFLLFPFVMQFCRPYVRKTMFRRQSETGKVCCACSSCNNKGRWPQISICSIQGFT